MAAWSVKDEPGFIGFGSLRRKLAGPNSCNEPFKKSYWCPRKKWFNREPCPFVNRVECDNFKLMCGRV